VADALPIAYLNGSYLPVAEASISPLDRGFLFADAVYEVIPVFGGTPLLLDAHLLRLQYSLDALSISNPYPNEKWSTIVRELATRNDGGDLAIYLQISRGADIGRDHLMPPNLTPTVFGLATRIPDSSSNRAGLAAVVQPDIRWGRCDIKSTALLANVLLRQQALEASAAEAILVRDGIITEGGSSSVIIVENGSLVTRPNSHALLPGTTRQLILDLAVADGIVCNEEEFSEARLRAADEIWLMSATRGVVPVCWLDGKNVGDGKPGPVWQRVVDIFDQYKSSLGE
jgi:D-alanine transaminase